MIIHKMTANFGRLENETLTLREGLNVIASPNESGKSTYCAFLRVMLYGIATAERERAGFKPDKIKYAPWSGAPMSGEIELSHGGQRITLRRGGKISAPMREVSAVYTGTEIPVPGINGDNAGEILVGVSKAVFERSAFISQPGLSVNGSAELEKRIAAIVSTGEESCSYSEAESRLREWQRKRHFRQHGEIPALDAEIDAISSAQEGKKRELASLEEVLIKSEALSSEIEELRLRVNDSRKRQRREALGRLGEAKAVYGAKKESAERGRTELERLEKKLRAGAFWQILIIFLLVSALAMSAMITLYLLIPASLILAFGLFYYIKRRGISKNIENAGQILREAEADLESLTSEQKTLEVELLSELDFSGGGSEAAVLGRRLSACEAELVSLRERRALLEGRLGSLGDPLVSKTELLSKKARREELIAQYDALSLALETLRDADNELRTRFSPMLARRAADYLSRMTLGRYGEMSLAKDMSMRVREDGDAFTRETEFLSAGAADQVYLALRLAICELALPQEEPCPLILDDALLTFDETRTRAAMEVLEEIAEKRQVILFTCK